MCVCSWPEKAMTGSWELINYMSALINNNIGQIQILIALVALWLAKKGYDQLILQIGMAQDQFDESEKQTKHYADQVKEAAKQTKFAAKQFENSNKQIDALIEHRNLVLEIRNNELKYEYSTLSVKTVERLQWSINELKKIEGLLTTKLRVLNFKNEDALEHLIKFNLEKIREEIVDFEGKIKQMINISGDLAVNNPNIDNSHIQYNIHTLNLMNLRAIRSVNIYIEFNNSIRAQDI